MEQRWYEAINETRSLPLASRTCRAATFGSRLRGLLGRSSFEPGEGLHLAPCNAIHTLFMRFPIDVLFLDRDGVVLLALSRLPPWRATRIVSGARSVLELPAGIIAATTTRAGDRVRFLRRLALDRQSAIR